mmetsp:Transcript_80191/g.231642  ORF Transcript_80191/g.231642 Transcript_80191/m.231642 type:complete len:307 (+) Transcript_80191:81-1001(+)
MAAVPAAQGATASATGKGAKGKGRGKGGYPPPPKPSAVPKPKAKPLAAKPLKPGESATLTGNLQAKGDEMDAEHATEIENVDMSLVDEDAKGETFQCPRCEKQVLVSMRDSHMSAHSSEILPWLFLGGTRNADNGRELTIRTGITHVLNVAHETNMDHDARAEWEAYNKDKGRPCVYQKFSWYDTPDQDIIHEMAGPVEFLRSVHEASKEHKVLVHCVQGISRSASVVIFYLMAHQRMSLREAFELTRRKRPVVEPRAEFLRQLGVHECKLFGLKAPTLTPEVIYADRKLLNVDDVTAPLADAVRS